MVGSRVVTTSAQTLFLVKWKVLTIGFGKLLFGVENLTFRNFKLLKKCLTSASLIVLGAKSVDGRREIPISKG